MSDPTRPHSPHLAKRITIDNGFSGGWMPHFVPSEEYWVDTHTHLYDVTGAESLKNILDKWFYELDAFRLGTIVALSTQDDQFGVFKEAVDNDPRFAWMYWPDIDTPSVARVREALKCNVCGIKLHNSPIMKGLTPRSVYDNPEWQEIFSIAEEAGIPLLWHITQRNGYSPYHGGGENPFWADGYKAGVNFTNEDLLSDAIKWMRVYPKLKIIGAHQLYTGPERLVRLFEEYENLYIDSSCGMFLRWADQLMEEDRLYLRDFVETWSDRIMFGTDSLIRPEGPDRIDLQGFLCHPRFMLALRLSDRTLQDVAWRNAKKMFNLKTVSTARKKSVRP